MTKTLGLLAAPILITLIFTGVSAEAKTIKVGDDWFGSASTSLISVKKNSKLTFRWVGKHPHNARVRKGPAKWNSGVRVKGSRSWRVKKRGTYYLVCDIHSGMKVTIKAR